MPRPRKKRPGNVTLLGEDINPQVRTAYLYRTNAKREPIGGNILRTSETITGEMVRERFGPGVYYLMETGGVDEDGNTMQLGTKTFIVDGEAEKTDALEVVDQTSDPFFRDMKELLKLKILEREARGEPNMLELLRAARDLVPQSNGDAVLNAFLRGADWNEPAQQSDPVTDVIGKLVESQATGTEGKWKRLAALYAQKVKVKEKQIEDLEREKMEYKTTLHNLTAGPVDHTLPDSTLSHTLVEAVAAIAASGAGDLTQALTEISQSAPNLIQELEALGEIERERIISEGLEPDYVERLEPYVASLETFLERVRIPKGVQKTPKSAALSTAPVSQDQTAPENPAPSK